MSEFPSGRTIAAVAAAAVVALVVGIGNTIRAGGDRTVVTVAATAPVVASTVAVHVTGAVVRAGVVTVPEGSRVADVIAAAGGAVVDADLSAINLAAPVGDGDQVHVPAMGETATREPGLDAGVDLNRADAATLETLDGVGPVLARRIIEYRETNGPFRSVEDLLDIPGIGEAKLAAMRPGIGSP